MMSAFRNQQFANLALIVLTAGGCVTPLASPVASPLASATVAPPVGLRFVDDLGMTRTFTLDIDDQSGLLVEATDGEAFSGTDPGANDLDPADHVHFLNDADDDSILRVNWLSGGGGCAASYAMAIDPTARTLRIVGPPAGSDSAGGMCGVTLDFSEPVPATQVEGVFSEPG